MFTESLFFMFVRALIGWNKKSAADAEQERWNALNRYS